MNGKPEELGLIFYGCWDGPDWPGKKAELAHLFFQGWMGVVRLLHNIWAPLSIIGRWSMARDETESVGDPGSGPVVAWKMKCTCNHLDII